MKKLTKTSTFEILGSNGQVIALFRVKALKQVSNRKPKADKVVTLTDLRNRWEQDKTLNHCYCADINLTQRTIIISGYNISHVETEVKEINKWGNIVNKYDEKRTYFEKSFKIGDEVEYGSYNLIYTAPIQNITKSYVEVKDCGRTKRMKLVEFVSRNYDLDLERIANHNMETSYYI